MNGQRFLLPALFALTVARLLFLPLHDLSEVERHAVHSSQQEGLWQPATGAILPPLIKLSTAVFGINPFGVRVLAPLFILGASWLLWQMVRGMFDATTASWSLVIFHVTPAVNVAAVTMTLTTLGIVCSIGTLAALRHALHRDYKWRLQWWLLGAVLAIALLVDWRLLMLTISCAAGMALTQRGRRALVRWPVLPVLGLCLGLTLTVFLAWNSEHGWTAFASFPGTAAPTLWQLTLHVMLAISPTLLAGYAWAMVQSVVRRPMEYAIAFLYAFAWPLLTLDMLSWMALPWPHCGFGTWIGPAAVLLAQHSMEYEKAPTRVVIWIRRLALLAAAAQSCTVMVRMISGAALFG